MTVAPLRAAEKRPPPLPGYVAASIWDGYTPPPYVIKRLLGPDEVTVLFGQSGHFKSVAAIDMALSVATGTPFQGVRARKAPVLYIAGEGHTGIKKRVRAWMLARGMTADSEQPALFITSAGADLIGNPEQLRSTAERAGEVLGAPVQVLILDTLAANFGPGDENHATDMGLAIASARVAAPGAAVMLIHHTGHGQVDRERGSYALVAAADYRVQATYDDVSKLLELNWLKCKDDDKPDPMAFEWRKVGLEWKDDDDEELTSVVLTRLDGVSATPQGPRSVGLGRNQETALRTLRTLYARNRKSLQEQGRDPAEARILLDGWRADCERKGIDRRRWREVLPDLEARRLIAIDGPHVTLAEVVP